MEQAELSALLRRHAARHSVPGAALGVVQDGVSTVACYGVANVGTGEPVVPQTRFSVGSLTKTMVATVIARLAEAGSMSIDDSVAKHVPELHVSPWADGVTLRDLMSNNSGLPLRADLEFGFGARADEDDGALGRFAADIGAGLPSGRFWSYSNAAWCVLGRAIETVTGTTWEEAMRTHLFEPLGMSGTALRGEVADVVAGHEVTAGAATPVEPLNARAYGPAGTTAVATIVDLLQFATPHIEDSALSTLREVHAEVAIAGWLDAWCLGMARFEWAGEPAWGWDGLISGERSVLRILPSRGVAVVLMTNGSTGRAMYRSLFSEFVPALLGIPFPTLRLEPSASALDLERFAGVYGWPDRRVEVVATDNGLVIVEDGLTQAAVPIDGCTFVVDREDPDTPTVTFADFDADGRPQVLYVMLWGLPRQLA